MKQIELLKVLSRKKARYMVVGGFAGVLYGTGRFTKDIDLVIDFSKENVKKVVEVLTEFDYKPRVPINPYDLADEKKRHEWINEKNALVSILYN
jgi:hypothetical protein